ncbi:MAG: hypothetical protein HY271_08520 [Deltaproteobacteria bacterium]|nr:hypothetical protein [Deltaproteobacteria bacterium]
MQAVLAAPIHRLGEREKQVLQTAAVIGKTFGEAPLRRVLATIARSAPPATPRAPRTGDSPREVRDDPNALLDDLA